MASSVNEPVTSGPLRGIKVLELSVARAGPIAARQLADFGADVIKIELPAEMEDPALVKDSFRNSSDFQNLHRNRRGITINLKHAEGIAVLKRMAEQCDVLIENFRPGVKERLGFDYGTLSKTNPRLVYASLSGFGQDGPYANRPGVDQILQGMGGMMSVTGSADGEPTRVGVAVVDFSTGLLLSYGILAALLERNLSGRGQWVKTSLLQTQIFMLDFQAARWLQDKEIPGRTGNDHPTFRPTGLFHAKDAQINIAPGPNLWSRLCEALGLSNIIDDPDFATIEARYANTERLTAVLEKIIATENAEVWVERLNAAGIPCGPINRIDQVFADRQVRHLGIVGQVVSDTLGTIDQVRPPLDFDRTPALLKTGAPTRGQHNREVLGEFGFSAEEITELAGVGAI